MIVAAARIASAAVAAMMVLAPATAVGQPWVLPQGQGSVGVIYHHMFVEDHLFAGSEVRQVGEIRTHVLTADIAYGLTDRWAIRAVLPYVAAKYTGGKPHKHPGSATPDDFHLLDDGTTHGAVQDLRGEVRYVWQEFPIAIAPFASLRIPSHDYQVFAHSAVGLGMTELQLGTYLGKRVGPLTIEGRVAYGIHERVAGYRRNRVTADTEVGWSAGTRVTMFLFQMFQVSHGGVQLRAAEVPLLELEPWWPHHDQIGQANSVYVGAGGAVQVTSNMALHATLSQTAAGSNTHSVKYAFTLGASWGIGSGSGRVHGSTRSQRP